MAMSLKQAEAERLRHEAEEQQLGQVCVCIAFVRVCVYLHCALAALVLRVLLGVK